MKRKRHDPEQIIKKLRDVDSLSGQETGGQETGTSLILWLRLQRRRAIDAAQQHCALGHARLRRGRQ